MKYYLYQSDNLDILRAMPDNSVDAIVTDPPYGLSFMAKKWDYDVPSVELWTECLRVLKPGGHLLSFAGTRTQHRMAVRIEDAGFEIRDLLMWHYATGFPKSKNLGGGFGSALKPATEIITMARKPLDGTLEGNFAKHGTGGLNIDGCRVGTMDDCARKPALVDNTAAGFGKGLAMGGRGHDAGRWPANLTHDGSDEVVALFPQTGASKGLKCKAGVNKGGKNALNDLINHEDQYGGYDDAGSAARYFYCAKTSHRDRNEGCEGMEQKMPIAANGAENAVSSNRGSRSGPRENHHPTVKPTDLMRYLCRLVTPPGGIVLDPFMGSGSTGKAAMLEGFNFIGIEKEPEYVEIARARIKHAQESWIREKQVAGSADV